MIWMILALNCLLFFLFGRPSNADVDIPVIKCKENTETFECLHQHHSDFGYWSCVDNEWVKVQKLRIDLIFHMKVYILVMILHKLVMKLVELLRTVCVNY